MSSICPACQKINSSANDVCDQCGMHLHEGSVEQTQALPPQDPPPTTQPFSFSATDALSGASSYESTYERALRPLTVRHRTEAEELTPWQATTKHPLPRTPSSPLEEVPASPPAPMPPLEPETGMVTATEYDPRTTNAPISIEIWFDRVLVSGHPSGLQLRVKNLRDHKIARLTLALESLALEKKVVHEFQHVGKRQELSVRMPIHPERAGVFDLLVTADLSSGGQKILFHGARSLAVNPAPFAPDRETRLEDYQLNVETEGNPAISRQRISFPNLTELLEFELKQMFQGLQLYCDYSLPSESIERISSKQPDLFIHVLYKHWAQRGTKLCLRPSPSSPKSRELHLCSRDEFFLGRSREQVDQVTWFLPRGDANDYQTKHQLSRKHVVARLIQEKIYLQDLGSQEGALFCGQSLSQSTGEHLACRGFLYLGHHYKLDVQRHPPTVPYPMITNLSVWTAFDDQVKESGAQGAITFKPENMEMAIRDVVWLFSNATFGRNPFNPIQLDSPQLAEIQGRFHYFQGCYWVENCVGNQQVVINDHVLVENEIAPLINGATLTLASRKYSIEVLE